MTRPWVSMFPSGFNPRAPDGARRYSLGLSSLYTLCFNPRAPDGARHQLPGSSTRQVAVSIHAPRMGRDNLRPLLVCVGREFQSTRPGWGATPCSTWPKSRGTGFNPRAPDGARPPISRITRPGSSFNPRAPDGARRVKCDVGYGITIVSIHAPRMGRDNQPHSDRQYLTLFQSTRPGWGATANGLVGGAQYLVSIHAPRMGRDCSSILIILKRRSFNPRAPDGARRPGSVITFDGSHVSIHAPRMGRDNLRRHLNYRGLCVSIHAPRMGRDLE